jgi:RNA polymerase sigma-70 factor (ECF subfamily)
MGDTDAFLAQRPRLLAIAYRMLGSNADAEDVVQEAYLRWQRVESADSAEAMLTTIVTRLSIDQLRSARARRESYVGPWLPEPVVVDEGADPARNAELADSLSLAFLTLLEELGPAERAAFLLREIFDYDYPQIARMLQKEQPATRQLVARARQRVAARRHRFQVDAETCRPIAEQFIAACRTGELRLMSSLLADDVVLWTDGGGVVQAARRPIAGADNVARFLVAVATKAPQAVAAPAWINGQPGVVVTEAGRVITAIVLDILDGLVVGVRLVANPDKLETLNACQA